MLVLLLLSCLSWTPAELAAHEDLRRCALACAGDAARVENAVCVCEADWGEWTP
jgi:hypothetical protein